MNYNEFQFIAQKILKYEAGDTTFTDMLPHMIGYTEKRIYTDFDFLCTLASQTTTLTTNTRTIALQTNVIVPQSLNILSPFQGLTRVGIDFINNIYPATATSALPEYWALIGNPGIGTNITAGAYNVILGPAPDMAYTLETIGTVRPTPLSETNTTTFISTYCPELFVAGAMVFGFGYQRDFGGQSDNPQAAMSWNAQYEAIKASVNTEQLRVKAASVSWSPYQPTPQANVQRDRASVPAPQ
ncbi:MAG TPA: hypothetical protein VFA65_24290 [Bryobacteraceae bacterium]|nr:hypothetical protein [Bryobacteraceae bacterium]